MKINRKELKKMKEGFEIIFQHAISYKRQVIVVGLLVFVQAFFAALGPYLFSLFIDGLVDITYINILGFAISIPILIVVIYVSTKLIDNVVGFFSDRISRKLMLKVSNDYMVSVGDKLLHYPVSFFKSQNMGKVYQVIGRSSSALQNIIGFQAPSFGVDLLAIIMSLIFVFFISPTIGMIVVVGLVLFGIITYKVMPAIGEAVERSNKVNNKASEHYYETMGNAVEVKRANMISKEVSRIKIQFLDKVFNVDLVEQYLWVTNSTIRRGVYVITQGMVLVVSVLLVQKNQLTIGELTAVNSYIMQTFRPFIRLSDMWLYLQSSAIKVKEAHDLFSKKEEQDFLVNPTKTAINGKISFKDVSFLYDKKDGQVLQDISFETKPGMTTALVGKSGSGKSTLVDLIGAFYFPQKGKVLIDGVSTRNIDLNHLRRHIAYVSQEVTLFNDTVAKNIAYGAGKKVTQSEIEEAARKAHCHEFITEFKKGYKQIVGERGVKLSVGQKQRIAIARAILRDPKILILDEPTSALDSESEKFITESLNSLMAGRTTFIIAHRLSTVRGADQILVLEKGKIVEKGNHEELMSNTSGRYKYLYDMHIGLN